MMFPHTELGKLLTCLCVGETRTNDQVWEEMRRLQRLGPEADQLAGENADALRQARMSPFEGLPDKV